LLREFDGKRLNGPNDLWISKTGEIYFTDPYYQRPWWNHKKMPQDGQHVYRVDRNGKNLKRVAEGLKQPNGIIGDRSRNLLYVADIGAGKTYKYQIDEQGELVNRELFCEQGSDGMTIDIAGNVYLTGKGVSVYSREGKHVATIEVPENWTANVCFGGAEQNQLFITASDSIYRLQMKTTAADHSGTK
jgi:gluconolactonase